MSNPIKSTWITSVAWVKTCMDVLCGCTIGHFKLCSVISVNTDSDYTFDILTFVIYMKQKWGLGFYVYLHFVDAFLINVVLYFKKVNPMKPTWIGSRVWV